MARRTAQICTLITMVARYSVFKEQPALELAAEAFDFPNAPASFSKTGGEYRDRTGDLLRARQALSQLS